MDRAGRARGRATATALAVLAAATLVVVWQTVRGDSASAAGNSGIVVSEGAPVTPAEFRGDVRLLPKTAHPVSPKPIVEPEAPALARKRGPDAPAVTAPSANMPAPSQSFAGLDFASWGAGHPPDTVGDVGISFYVQAVNTSIGIFAKTGGAPLAAFTFNTLWAAAATSTPCDTNNNGDPTVVYDPIADRYIVADFAWTNFQSGPYYECIAVSKTGNPVTGGWWLYSVRADDAAHPWLPDYPKMGIWPDGLYMTANMFDCSVSCSYQEVRAYAFNRSDLESGATLRSIVADLGSASYFSLLPSNLRGAVPPAGRENLLVSESETAFAWEVWRFHVDWALPGNSTFTGPTNVSQAAYTFATATVPSSGNNLDALAERLMMQNQYRNLGGSESLWVNHTVRTGSSGPNGIQWAQINVTGGTVSTAPVQQQIYGNVGGDGLHRWMGSLAVDGSGNMALGYSTSKAAVNPDIRYSGRLASDSLNTLPQGEAILQTGGGSQTGNCGGSACTRWGDYSAMTVDPVDGCTFWYTNEYYAAGGLNWQTRIGAFKFPSCGAVSPTVTSTVPSSSVRGVSNILITVNGTNFVSGAVVSFSGTYVVVNSTSFVSSTQLTANVTIHGVAAFGTRDVTVTNPGGGSGTCVACFTVTSTSGSPPTVTSTNPSSSVRGVSNILITVNGTNFVNGAVVSFSGTFVQVNSTSFVSSVQLTANVTIHGVAALGPRDVTVTNPGGGGSGTCVGCFTVGTPSGPPPTVTSASPSSLPRGVAGSTVTILGTNFVSGATVSFGDGGVRVTSTTFGNSGSLTLVVKIKFGAIVGAHNVTVTNPDGTSGTCVGCFTVT